MASSDLKLLQRHVQSDISPLLPTELLNPPELFILSNGDLIAFHLLFLPFVNMIPAADTRFQENIAQSSGPQEQYSGNDTAQTSFDVEMRNLALSAKFRRSAVQYIEVERGPQAGHRSSRNCSIVSPRSCEASFKAALERWRELQKYIRPSTIVLLHSDQLDGEGFEESRVWHASFDENTHKLLPEHKKAVFLMEFSKVPLFSNSGSVLQVPLKGHLLCAVCENSAAEYNRWAKLRGYKTKLARKLVPDHKFECESTEASSCWPTMSWKLEEVAQGGRSVFWELAETTVTSLHNYCVKHQNPPTKPILGSWTVANQMDYTLSLGSNFSAPFGDFGCYLNEMSRRLPKEHVFDSASLARHFPARNALITSLNPDLSTDRMENLVYVTEVGVQSSNSAIDLYLNPMESPVWCAFIGALLIGCAAFATLSSFEPQKMRGGGAKTWRWRHWFSRFAQMLQYLGELFVDQSNSELLIRQRTSVVVSMVLPWLLAILIATNGFKSFFKARFLLPFPYKLINQTRWQDFAGYSFYAIGDPSVKCNCSHNGRNIEFNSNQEGFIMQASDQSLIPHWLCTRYMRGNTPVHLHYKMYFEHFRPSFGKSITFWSPRILHWFSGLIQKATAARKSGNQAELNSIGFQLVDKLRSELTIGQAERICRHCLGDFVGSRYQEVLREHKGLRTLLEAAGHNMSLNSFLIENNLPCLSSERKTGAPKILDLFWATREYKAVFVIPANQFPWLWNLFKRQMKADPRLKFAYIGPKQLKTSRAQLLDSNPTNSHAYIERQFQHETWMTRRIAALHTSGLLDFWNKWHYIRRNLVKEFVSAEVDEKDKEFKPLAVADPSLKLLFIAVYTALLSLVPVLVLEILVSLVHLVDVEIN